MKVVEKYDDLRNKHPEFVYNSFSYLVQPHALELQFEFILKPGLYFRPVLTFHGWKGTVAYAKELEVYFFHIGLVEMLSYWKAACSPLITVNAGKLSDAQIEWWKDLILHGLGEFYYRNEIDCTASSLVTVRASENSPQFQCDAACVSQGNLILVGGGKDSSLTVELLSEKGRANVFALNPTRASLQSAALVGFKNPLVANRVIDKKLLELNKAGYLNGHTPFSAYLAFVGSLAGRIHGYSEIITSNERSADEQNVVYKGVPINHQYSKSFRFENLFREYAKNFLSLGTHYWSFLRPLHDLQISALFALRSRQLPNFRSCNVNQRKDSWCGNCAKCAFVYLSLFPFVETEGLKVLFGADLFQNDAILEFVRELVGLTSAKPFECVGSIKESQAALCLSYLKMVREGRTIPPKLTDLYKLLPESSNKDWIRELLSDWNSKHFLPPKECDVLQETLATLNFNLHSSCP